MTKKEEIQSYFEEYKSENITLVEIAVKIPTSGEYVRQVISAMQLEEELEIERRIVFNVKPEPEPFEEPKFEWEELMKSKIHNIEITPKVNLLPDGRVELIYKSRM